MSLTLAQKKEMKQDGSLVLARLIIAIDTSVKKVRQALVEDFAAIIRQNIKLADDEVASSTKTSLVLL